MYASYLNAAHISRFGEWEQNANIKIYNEPTS
jgi:hypothetical protein